MKKKKKVEKIICLWWFICIYGDLFVLIVLLVAVMEEEIEMGFKFDNHRKNREGEEE